MPGAVPVEPSLASGGYFWLSLIERSPHKSIRFRQQRARGIRLDAPHYHHDRRLSMPIALLKCVESGGTIYARGCHDDPLRPVSQLGIRGFYIDHEVSVRFPK